MIRPLCMALAFFLFGNSDSWASGRTHEEEKSGVAKRRLTEVDSESEPKRKRSTKSSKPEKKAFVPPENVDLRLGKGSKECGGGKGGYYWNIFVTEKKSGKIFINLADSDTLGSYPSVQIFLNKASQGKHIGRHAYLKACESSHYDTVYAHIAKKNLASIKSAQAAGFKEVEGVSKQMLMRWVRLKP